MNFFERTRRKASAEIHLIDFGFFARFAKPSRLLRSSVF